MKLRTIIELNVFSGCSNVVCKCCQLEIIFFKCSTFWLRNVLANFLILEENDVNMQTSGGYTPLMIASLKAHEDIVRLLLQHGADPNINNNYEESPLMFAARAESLACVCMLLDAGANIDQKSYDGMTALHYAVFKNCNTAPIITCLIDKGARIDAEDEFEITPFFRLESEFCGVLPNDMRTDKHTTN